MDYFAHGLWSYIFFNKTKKPWLAVIFGLLPDTFSWFIYMIYRFFNGPEFGKPNLQMIPEWMNFLYGITHSLIIALLFFVIVYFITKKVYYFLLAWPIHILIDIPTHSREFLPTPFLWPLSNWYFPGISWGTKWFMITNWSLIIISLCAIIYYKRKKQF
jgi:hypothetical protein